jgi:hypothetical protein
MSVDLIEAWPAVLGDGYPVTLACRADLARASHAAGQAGSAVALLRDTITGREARSADGSVIRALRQMLAGFTAEMTGG